MEPAPPVQAPDPVATAQAQTASNIATAETQAELNHTNQINPDGTSTWQVIGTNPDGTPQYQQTTSLSAANQGVYDTNQATKQNLANIGQDQSAKIGTLLDTPFNVDQSIADKITSLGKTNLDPQWAANDAKQAASLANQGITPGSEAYDNAMRSYNASKSQAYNNLYLQGDAQAEQESLANRNQPINEISALLSGTQVGTPQFGATPQTSVGGTDVAGITQNSYLDANQQAQQSVAANNAMMGGLFSLGGTLGGASILKYSDERLKENKKQVGEVKTDDGVLPLYAYNYKAGGPREIGLMAQDVEKKIPDAVSKDSEGYRRVNYGRVLAGMVA